MGIKKNPKTNRWDVSVCKRHPITRQPKSKRRLGVESEAKAKRVERELFLELEDELKRQVIPTWRKAVKEFIEDFSNRDISLKTVESYKLCLEKHTLPTWGDRLVTTINEQEVRSLINSLSTKVSISHQKNVLKFIRAVFSFANSKHYITHIPVPKMSFRIGDKHKGTITESQVKELLSRAKEVESEWYPIWATALYTGMRSGELIALTWDKVDFENRKIKVDCSWNSKDGFKSTKSGHDRWVEIAAPLEPILLKLKEKNENPPFVLPQLEKWKAGDQARELRSFLLALGLPRIRFHDLRATWCTLLLSKGVPAYQVMIAGGWSSYKTLELYLRKSAVDIRGLTDKLNFD